MAYLDAKDVYDLFENGVAHLHVADIDVLPRADVKEVKHGYWTGRTFVDDAHSEGFSSSMSEEEKQSRRESDAHATHCSVCGAMFDDRFIDGWKGCPHCFSILDLERPNNAYFLAWETKRASMEESAKRCGYVIDWEELK